MNDGLAEELRRWAAHMDQREYFEAHEVLEGAWLAAREPDKTFLKGLIHAAVALYQYHRRNGHGARVKALSCTRYLSPYRPHYQGVAVAALLEELQQFVGAHLQQPRGLPPPEPKLPWPRSHLDPGAGRGNGHAAERIRRAT